MKHLKIFLQSHRILETCGRYFLHLINKTIHFIIKAHLIIGYPKEFLIMFNLRTVALAAMIMVVGAGEALALSCVGRYQTGNSWSNSGIIVSSYSLSDVGITPLIPGPEKRCSDKNKAKAFADTKSQAVANSACAAGVSNGQIVQSFSKAGAISTGGVDHVIGYLIRANAVYSCPSGYSLSGTNCSNSVAPTYTCPSGTWKEGAKCVRQGCAVGSMNPKPNAWVGIAPGVNAGGNSTGWITDDQGGTRFFSNATSSCSNGGSIVNGNCVKTIAATVTTPAICKF